MAGIYKLAAILKNIIMKITPEQMSEALKRSGYFLETRVLDVLAKNGYQNFPNQTYPDLITGKSREVDIISHAPRITKNLNLNYSLCFEYKYELIIECINNSQPVAFFKRPDKNPYTIFGKFEFAKVEREVIEMHVNADHEFHTFTTESKEFHYNSKEKNTQYCSFSPKKADNKEWMASHSDALHDTFGKLNDFLQHSMPSYEKWIRESCAWRNDVFAVIKFPVLILQNDLLEVSEVNGEVSIEEKKHIIFEYSKYSEKRDYILIDVITEDYLPEYIKIVNNSMTKLRDAMMNFYSDKNPLWCSFATSTYLLVQIK
jgi:hypothetical protein